MLEGLSVTIALLAGRAAIPWLFLRYERRRYIVTGLAQLEKWVEQQDVVAIAEPQGLWVSRADGRGGLPRIKDGTMRKSRTSRIGRTVRRMKQIWAERDYAQRRSMEIRTGVPMLKPSPRPLTATSRAAAQRPAQPSTAPKSQSLEDL